MPSAGSYICRVDVTIRAYEPRDAADLADVFFRSVPTTPDLTGVAGFEPAVSSSRTARTFE